MDLKKIKKSFSRLLGWLGLHICSLIIKITPARFLYRFAKMISSLAYSFAKKQKNIAFDSLRTAFGQEKSKAELDGIVRLCFDYIAKSAVELMFLMDKPQLLKDRVDIIGRDNLDKALSRKKGVILVSAHFGNFPLLLGRLAVEGYKTAGIMRPMRDSRVEKVFLEKREKFGVKTIYSQPRNLCVNNTILSLRNNELVFIPIDQNFGTAGVFVNFFGRKAATATGPVIFAQRTDAALIPCFILRQKDDRHKIVFEPALDLQEGGDSQETVLINIQKLTDIIETYIRKYPAEWGWIHRRWKSQPS
ncbi:MAG: lysophospholipid acyltransferase family protein [Candidatus Omnitrophota bacterium]|jgi:KDO2-lipid IV(A) lauroyltransferase|nr:lysophospholipid acyltransferase family protein [Candidatus Omnitrophota bacterium]